MMTKMKILTDDTCIGKTDYDRNLRVLILSFVLKNRHCHQTVRRHFPPFSPHNYFLVLMRSY